MKRNLNEIRSELRKRDINTQSVQEVLLGGVMLAVEDLEEGLKIK